MFATRKNLFHKPTILLILTLSFRLIAFGNSISTQVIEAEDFDEQSGIQTESCQEGGQNIGYIENGDYIKFNTVDFGSGARYLNVRCASNTNGGVVNIHLDSLTGSPQATLEIINTGGWQSWKTFSSEIEEISGVHTLFVTFTGAGGYLFNLNWLSFGSTPINTSVSLLFPDDNEELTDIACSFKAKISTDGPFTLYLSKTEDFSGNIITHVPVSKNGESKDSENIVYFLTLQGKLKPSEKFLLTPGTWFWKISGDGGQTFSETRKLTVNNEHPTIAPKRIVDAEHPIFHARLRGRIFDFDNPVERLKRIVPDALKEYVVLDIGTSFSFIPNGRSLYDFCKLFNDAGYKFYFDLGAHSLPGRIASLGEMEKVFRELPNCVGAATGELNYYYPYNEEDNSLLRGALELCQKYGRHFLLADMNWNWAKWQLFSYRFYDFFMSEGYGPYFIPQFKTTDPWGSQTCVSAIQGMKLAGMADNIGIWSDMWCWEKFGQVNTIELTDWMEGSHNADGGQNAFPFIQTMKTYLWGMTFGATTFALEPTLWAHWETCEPNDLHSRYLLPFIQAVARENIVPSENAINNNFNVIVDTEFKSNDFGQSPRLSYLKGNPWGDFVRSTYGISDIEPYNEIYAGKQGDIIQAAYVEMIPNTDKYPSGIPFLPKPSTPAPMANGKKLKVVKLSQLQNKTSANVYLNPYYPETESEAFAVKIDSSIFVFNTIENHDIKQKYKLGIHHAGIDSLYGEVPLLNYVMGRIRPDGKSLFIQTNAYIKNSDLKGARYNLPSYPSILHFKCQAQPALTSNEMSAITKSWDAEKGVFTVRINHATAGAVDFVLSGNENISYAPDSIKLETKKVTLKVGEQFQLGGTLYPETIKGIGLTWRSLNSNIANVSRSGLVQGVKEGSVELIAEIKGISDTVLCVVDSKVGIPKVSDGNISIYPNPASERVYISGISAAARITVMDLFGKTVIQTQENPISVKNMKPGVYVLSLNDKGNLYTQTLLCF